MRVPLIATMILVTACSPSPPTPQLAVGPLALPSLRWQRETGADRGLPGCLLLVGLQSLTRSPLVICAMWESKSDAWLMGSSTPRRQLRRAVSSRYVLSGEIWLELDH
jgi:hypothetical protein